jgi:hypothetical protein
VERDALPAGDVNPVTKSASTSPKATFRAKLLPAGKTATGFEVPSKMVEALGAGKRPPVKVTINGHTYRSTVAVYGGKFLLGVSAENRKRAGMTAGDTMEVELALDSAPREVTVPNDFAAALKRDKDDERSFSELSYNRMQWFVLSIEGAKTAETRARRIAKAVTTLGKERA